MREIIAVCRSEKASRDRVARVLDRYFWRIGDRTWRGKATNACLDRVSKELRKRATRNTAVVIHEIRSSSESRVPIIRIGSRHAFSDEGLFPCHHIRPISEGYPPGMLIMTPAPPWFQLPPFSTTSERLQICSREKFRGP